MQPEQSADGRAAIYHDLHHNQIRQQEEQNRVSAELILGEVFRHFAPTSVLDVGCGVGTWLETAQRLGVPDVMGIEGNWLDRSLTSIPAEKIVNFDLERPFDIGRRFDLVICLEVAEHLHAAAAELFIDSLARHADVVLFSAAIPFQGGHHHVNEQFLDYWAALFERHDYLPVDCLRPLIWTNPNVLWWLRQNIVLFAKREWTTGSGPLASLAGRGGPLSIVHPDVYRDRVQTSPGKLDEHNQLLALLSSGSNFSVVKHANGQLTITCND
jgi:SAM-dependent methyltransferase